MDKSELNSKLIDKKIAVIGASTQVGRRFLALLQQIDFPKADLFLLDTEPGKVSYNNDHIECILLSSDTEIEYDIIFNTLPSKTIKQYIGNLWNDHCFIIDNSNAFRMDHEVPLIVPEINLDRIGEHRLIAIPNPIVVMLANILYAILPCFQSIQQIAVSTYQSVSSAGHAAMRALLDETKQTFFDPKIAPEFFDKQIAFNLLPKIGDLDENFSTDEENKIVSETNKVLRSGKLSIFEDWPNLPLSVLCVRVPVLLGNCIALHISGTFDSLNSIFKALESHDGIECVPEDKYITPIECAHEDRIYVSRVKRTETGLALWLACDNIGKGAAYNAFAVILEKFKDN